MSGTCFVKKHAFYFCIRKKNCLKKIKNDIIFILTGLHTVFFLFVKLKHFASFLYFWYIHPPYMQVFFIPTKINNKKKQQLKKKERKKEKKSHWPNNLTRAGLKIELLVLKFNKKILRFFFLNNFYLKYLLFLKKNLKKILKKKYSKKKLRPPYKFDKISYDLNKVLVEYI